MSGAVEDTASPRLRAGLCFGVTVAVLVAFSLARAAGLLGPPVVAAVVLTVAVAVVALACHARLHHLGLAGRDVRAGVLYGAGALGVVAGVLVLAAVIPATSSFLHDSRAEISGGQLAYEVGVTVVLLTAIPEELAFRGALLGSALGMWRPWPAALVSSALFGLWHIEPTLDTMSDNRAVSGASSSLAGQSLVVAGAVAVTFVAGLLFCWLRMRSRSLVAPFIAHVATNGVALVVAWFALH
jgi:membrane protease YdiL (CAAX protease family)